MAELPRLGFVGAGRVASSLAVGLAAHGYPVAAVASRHPPSAAALAQRLPGACAAGTAQSVVDQSNLVFLTVPDDAIRATAESLLWRSGVAAVHCSGATEVDALHAPHAAGAAVGALHPLQTFLDRQGDWRHLAGATFTVEADEPLAATLAAMARALGGRPLRLPPGARALYHVSGAFACGFVATLLDVALRLWTEQLGFSREDARAALLPLLRGTVDNLERADPATALTGPVARGDVGTIDRHLAALGHDAPEYLPAYAHLVRLTIPLAEARGTLNPESAAAMRALVAPATDHRHALPT